MEETSALSRTAGDLFLGRLCWGRVILIKEVQITKLGTSSGCRSAGDRIELVPFLSNADPLKLGALLLNSTGKLLA
jgi:hypothetical protein